MPPVNLLSRAICCHLGTRSEDVEDLEKFREDEKIEIVEGGGKLRDNLEEEGLLDRYEKQQGAKPDVDDTLIGARIGQLWHFTEKDGTIVLQWCRGVVVSVRKGIRCIWNGIRIAYANEIHQ